MKKVDCGIDTMRFHKAFHPDIVNEIIMPKMGRDKNGLNWFHGILTFRNTYDGNRFSFQLSPSNLISGNNFIPATPEIIEKGIRQFEEMTGLRPIYRSQLSQPKAVRQAVRSGGYT